MRFALGLNLTLSSWTKYENRLVIRVSLKKRKQLLVQYSGEKLELILSSPTRKTIHMSCDFTRAVRFIKLLKHLRSGPHDIEQFGNSP